MYVGAAQSLMAVPSAAKPTSWLKSGELSSPLSHEVGVRLLPSTCDCELIQQTLFISFFISEVQPTLFKGSAFTCKYQM